MARHRILLLIGLGASVVGLLIWGESTSEGPRQPETCAGTPVRYDEQDLHAAYEMTREMSRPETAPMWADDQLRRSLTDPLFVQELEAHLCQLDRSLGAE